MELEKRCARESIRSNEGLGIDFKKPVVASGK